MPIEPSARRNELPTLRRELMTALALVFAGALLVFALGVLLILPRVAPVRESAVSFTVLVVLVVALFALFGRFLIQRRVLGPMREIVTQIETIAAGEFDRRLPEGDTRELSRLSAAVNHMAERLIADQAELAANIQSLDATNRLLTEARDAMVHAEKMASVGRLSAGIAHEVGNPLGAILGYLGLIGRNADEPSLDLVRSAEREAHRIDRIVRGLLDYARPRETRFLEVSTNRVVRDTLELMETQGKMSGFHVDLELADGLPPVIGDPYQLQQVLVNLLVNAVDALADTKQPQIRVATRARKWTRARHEPARRRDDPPGIDYSHRRRLARISGRPVEEKMESGRQVVEIEVSDNGPGIDAALLDQIFEPFVTTKEPGKGTGLGLAVSARLVETMGGVLRASSQPGSGAAFTVVLPVLRREKAAKET